MFRKLLPKEEKYFENFREMVQYLSEMANLTLKLFSSDEFDKSIILDIKPIEKRCDEITTKVFKRLNHMSKRVHFADEISSIIVKQIEALEIAIQDLKVKNVSELKAVKDLETEADDVYHRAIRELFMQEKDAIELIKKKKVLGLLEDASDKCQSAANVILAIFIKNA